MNDKTEKRIDQLAKMTEGQLFKLSAIFPFDFFPNKIFIEQKQIIIIYNKFLSSKNQHILIEDILSPVVESGLFFSTLRFELGAGGFMQNPPPVQFLNKKDATRAKRIIIGLLICHKEKIDLSNMTTQAIIEKVEEIGRVKRD